jgi:hypothetical protein
MAKKPKDSTNLELESKALQLVITEKTRYETATAFITRRVAFQMRNLIELLRKNYWGVFDEQNDPVSGQKKIWIPLTEYLVEGAIKSIDLDTKDINFRSKNASKVGLVSLVRNIVRAKLDDMNFGEKLDLFERYLAIDGTAVWSTEEKKEKDGVCAEVRNVDILNVYIDPTAPSIAEASSFIERIILPISEARDIGVADKWVNMDKLTGSTRVDRNNTYGVSTDTGETPMVELFKRRGWASKDIITGKKEDAETYIPTEIICSGTNGKWVFHAASVRDDNKNKGYEEAWYSRVPGRWYGRGVAEKVMGLQLYANMTANLRLNRARIAQLGIFKLRAGSGLTSQAVNKLGSNGIVTLKNMDDLQQFVVQDVPQSSYNDEQVINTWAQRVTSVFETTTGERMPSSMPATNAAISNSSQQSSFGFIREGIGMFLQRWLRNQSMPIFFKDIKPGDIIRITGDVDQLRVWDESMVNQMVYEQLEAINKMGWSVDPVQVEMERQNAIAKLSKMGSDRFVAMDESIDFLEYDAYIDVTNESYDKSVLANNLVTALQAAPEYRESILKNLFDIMGLNSSDLKASQPAMQGSAPQQVTSGQAAQTAAMTLTR